MARNGLSYYQVNTDRFFDIAMKRLKKHFGCEGYAVYSYLDNELTRTSGYYIKVDDDTIFDVADYWSLDEGRVADIITYCCEVGLFDKATFEAHQVITSAAIQERFVCICKKAHKSIHICEDYALLTAPEVAEAPTAKVELTDIQNFAKIRENSRRTREESDNKITKDKISPSNSPITGEPWRKEVNSLVSKVSAAPMPKPAEPDKAEHRNEQGLLAQLAEWNVPIDQMQAICTLTRYGEIGNPVWGLLNEVRCSRGKITMPGRFLIARLKQLNQATA